MAFGLVFSVTFAPGTKEEDGNQNEKSIKTVAQGDSVDGGLVRELSDTELRKIVAEQPLDDPLNAFYDPYEPYRLSTFAYWNPITFPKEHANPPLPAGFLPPNAPPKSFPSDFFFHDDEARRIVLGEHAAAFCPYLRRWRDKHPLKPYPVEADFLQRHPPIKFTPGKGYDIDMELARLNFLTRQAQEEILKKAEQEARSAENKEKYYNENDEGKKSKKPKQSSASQEQQPKAQQQNQKESTGGKVNKSIPTDKKKGGKKMTKKIIWELDVLMDMIERVRNSRSDCKKFDKFLEKPLPTPQYLSTPPDCLQEVIFFMDELEDIHDPISLEDDIPEINDKVEYYRHILIKLKELKTGKKKGKCPFGFKGGKDANAKSVKVYQGSIPNWAESKPGEKIYSSDDDEDGEWDKIEKYRFAYKQVPFPSIQDTLKKYVSI